MDLRTDTISEAVRPNRETLPNPTGRPELFALLAFQQGLIDSGQLRRSIRKWYQSEYEDLEQLLLLEGLVSPEQQGKLNRLMTKFAPPPNFICSPPHVAIAANKGMRQSELGEQLIKLEGADLKANRPDRKKTRQVGPHETDLTTKSRTSNSAPGNAKPDSLRGDKIPPVELQKSTSAERSKPTPSSADRLDVNKFSNDDTVTDLSPSSLADTKVHEQPHPTWTTAAAEVDAHTGSASLRDANLAEGELASSAETKLERWRDRSHPVFAEPNEVRVDNGQETASYSAGPISSSSDHEIGNGEIGDGAPDNFSEEAVELGSASKKSSLRRSAPSRGRTASESAKSGRKSIGQKSDNQRSELEQTASPDSRRGKRRKHRESYDYYDSVHASFTQDERWLPSLRRQFWLLKRFFVQNTAQLRRSCVSIAEFTWLWTKSNRLYVAATIIGLGALITGVVYLAPLMRSDANTDRTANAPANGSAASAATLDIDRGVLGSAAQAAKHSEAEARGDIVGSPNATGSDSTDFDLLASGKTATATAAMNLSEPAESRLGLPSEPRLPSEKTSVDHLNAANEAITKAQFPAALASIEEALKLAPDDVLLKQAKTAILLLGKAYPQAGRELVAPMLSENPNKDWDLLFTAWLLFSSPESKTEIRGQLMEAATEKPNSELIKRAIACIDAMGPEHASAFATLSSDPLFGERTLADQLCYSVCTFQSGIKDRALQRYLDAEAMLTTKWSRAETYAKQRPLPAGALVVRLRKSMETYHNRLK